MRGRPLDNLARERVNVNFNPRPLMRGRPTCAALKEVSERFQSTPPHEGATGEAADWHGEAKAFQSTPPHEGATIFKGMDNPEKVFQSTPPHEGATGTYSLSPGTRAISIHAPS